MIFTEAEIKEAMFKAYQLNYLSSDNLNHNKVLNEYMRSLEKQLGI